MFILHPYFFVTIQAVSDLTSACCTYTAVRMKTGFFLPASTADVTGTAEVPVKLPEGWIDTFILIFQRRSS
jgi:hypothetical protein